LPGLPPEPSPWVILSFFGTDGTLLSQQQTTVEPGQSVYLDLSGATFSGEFTAQLIFVGESRALTTSSLD